MSQLYDSIGQGYRRFRQPDPRIAALLAEGLGDAESVINLGAGAGSYEPSSRRVLALELSATMIAQRPPDAAPVVQARVEAIPCADGAFDAALGVLTLHHWSDQVAGLREARRVSRRQVFLTWVGYPQRFWLDDYFPEVRAADEHLFPSLEQLEAELGPLRVRAVQIPWDYRDGFLCAYWRRPEAYLDSGVRGAISTLARVPDDPAAVERLRADLASGRWRERHGELLAREEMDYGYRVVVAGP